MASLTDLAKTNLKVKKQIEFKEENAAEIQMG